MFEDFLGGNAIYIALPIYWIQPYIVWVTKCKVWKELLLLVSMYLLTLITYYSRIKADPEFIFATYKPSAFL